ncbi:MAG: hypothetical protein ACRCZD_17405 [Phycicoccus sp.]
MSRSSSPPPDGFDTTAGPAGSCPTGDCPIGESCSDLPSGVPATCRDSPAPGSEPLPGAEITGAPVIEPVCAMVRASFSGRSTTPVVHNPPVAAGERGDAVTSLVPLDVAEGRS